MNFPTAYKARNGAKVSEQQVNGGELLTSYLLILSKIQI